MPLTLADIIAIHSPGIPYPRDRESELGHFSAFRRRGLQSIAHAQKWARDVPKLTANSWRMVMLDCACSCFIGAVSSATGKEGVKTAVPGRRPADPPGAKEQLAVGALSAVLSGPGNRDVG